MTYYFTFWGADDIPLGILAKTWLVPPKHYFIILIQLIVEGTPSTRSFQSKEAQVGQKLFFGGFQNRIINGSRLLPLGIIFIGLKTLFPCWYCNIPIPLWNKAILFWFEIFLKALTMVF